MQKVKKKRLIQNRIISCLKMHVNHAVLVFAVLMSFLAYAMGILGHYRSSDGFLIIAVLTGVVLLIKRMIFDETEMLYFVFFSKQIGLLIFLEMLLVTAVLIYRKGQINWGITNVIVVISSYVSMGTFLYGLWKRKVSICVGIRKFVSQNLFFIILCLAFTILSFPEVFSITQWDSTTYLSSVNYYAQTNDLTFKTILTTNMGGHLSTGYTLFAGIGQMLIPNGNYGIKLSHIIMGQYAIYCFSMILRRYGIKGIQRILCTLIFTFSPMFFGTIGVIATDYAVMIFFVFFLYCYLYGKDILGIFFAVCFVLTKETSIAIYMFFWVGIAIYRLMLAEVNRKISWKNIWFVFSREEWKLILCPAIFFISSFFMYAQAGISWPAMVLGKGVTPLLILLLMMSVVLFVTLFMTWVNIWNRLKCKKNKSLQFRLLQTMVGFLPILLIVLGIWVCSVLSIGLTTLDEAKMIENMVFGRFGFSLIHIKEILIQASVFHFSWIFIFLLVIGLIRLFVYDRTMKNEGKEFVFAILISDMGLLLFTMFYVTYRNPRYLQLHYMLMILCVALLWRKIFPAKNKTCFWIRQGVALVLALLLFVESYCFIDPFTYQAFYNRDIGNGYWCAGTNDTLGKNFSCSYSDRAVNNRVYSYYWKNMIKFLKDINYDGTQKLVFPKNSSWVIMGTNNFENLDKELKCKISYNGSIEDSIVKIKPDFKMDKLLKDGRTTYYIDMGALHSEVDAIFAEQYTEYIYDEYITGPWKITVYCLQE